MKVGLRDNMKRNGGLITPSKYIKLINRRRKLGTALAVFTDGPHIKTLVELQGRPELAKKVANYYEKKDPFLAQAIRYFAAGPKLKAKERKEASREIKRRGSFDGG